MKIRELVMDYPSLSESLKGQTALVVVGSDDATGMVTSVEDQLITIACDQPCCPSGETRQVSVRVFAEDALYLISGQATAQGTDLVFDSDVAIERIQRRRWPRKRMELPVRLCSVESGTHVGGVPGRTIDVSVGGVRVVALRELEGEGDPMVILNLPDGSTIVAATSTVAVEDLGDGWRYRLAFRNLDGDDADRLTALTTV
jgi:hypothetical protein